MHLFTRIRHNQTNYIIVIASRIRLQMNKVFAAQVAPSYNTSESKIAY